MVFGGGVQIVLNKNKKKNYAKITKLKERNVIILGIQMVYLFLLPREKKNLLSLIIVICTECRYRRFICFLLCLISDIDRVGLWVNTNVNRTFTINRNLINFKVKRSEQTKNKMHTKSQFVVDISETFVASAIRFIRV